MTKTIYGYKAVNLNMVDQFEIGKTYSNYGKL